MLDRIGKGDRISLGGAVVLFISLFLTWYKVSGGIISVSSNAFDTLKYTDILLLIGSIAVVALILLIAQGTVDAALSPIVLVIGAVATLLVLFRLISIPVPDGIDASRGVGIFIGLIGAIAIAVGQVMKAQER